MLFEEVLIIQDGKLVLKEEAEELRTHTCAVSGSVEAVEAFIQDKEVIHQKKMAGMMTAYLFATEEEANAHGLHVEGIPVQELMIHLTDGKRSA